MESDVDLNACLSVGHDCDAHLLRVVSLREARWSIRVIPDAVVDSLIGMYKIYTGKYSSLLPM